MQNWVIVDEKYLDYLREFEPRIPYSNYGEANMKPFFGALFEVDDLIYVTQVSHPQTRHLTMHNALDFHKIYLPNDSLSLTDRLAAVVNLNYMFPLPKTMLKFLDYSTIEQHRTFSSLSEKSKYIDLLKKEMIEINKSGIDKKALRLYELKLNYPDNKTSRRCVNFKFLEDKAKTYITNV